MLSPRAVREADLVERFWPAQQHGPDEAQKPAQPRVGLQLSMAPAGSFCNFRLSPGGAATWLHVVSGKEVTDWISPLTQLAHNIVDAGAVEQPTMHTLNHPRAGSSSIQYRSDQARSTLPLGLQCMIVCLYSSPCCSEISEQLEWAQVFALLPPSSDNLAAYVSWSGVVRQAGVFLAEHAAGCVRLEVPAGATLFIPGKSTPLTGDFIAAFFTKRRTSFGHRFQR